MTKSEKNYLTESSTFYSSIDEKSHVFHIDYLPKEALGDKIIHIVFQHGMIEYYKRHEELFEALLSHFKRNIIVSAMDFVGHGQSGGHRSYVKEFKNLTDDWLRFLEICHSKYYQDKEVETFVIAHSLGGLVVLNTLSNEEYEIPIDISAIVLTNPCIAPKLKLPFPVEKTLLNLNSLLRRVRVPLIYDAYDLTHDHDRAVSFIHDHLISKSVTIQLALETLKATKNLTRHSYFFKYDTLFILSGDDRLVDNEKTRLFITGMDKKKVKSLEYPNMCHDILNETCRNEVFQEIIKYIENKRN
jgi:lysophospholipase